MIDLDKSIWSRLSSASSSKNPSRIQSTDTSRSESASRIGSPVASVRDAGAKADPNLPQDVIMHLSYGAKFNCCMSTIRKYFCLLVMFDLLMHFLIYLRYLQHADDFTLASLVQCQMTCYNIRSSFMDIIILSIVRFIALETTYGVIQSNSWAGTALTTALTSVFIIVKPFHYDWENECQRIWPVALILISFAWAWLEAFLVDCRLIDMENLAQKYEDDYHDSLWKDLPRTGVFSEFVPITNDLFRSIAAVFDSLTMRAVIH